MDVPRDVIFIVIFCVGALFIGLRALEPRRAKPPLGMWTRLIAALFILIGLATFFIPNISVAPPVLGEAHWSPQEIALHLWNGALPVGAADGHTWMVGIYIAGVYLSLLLALLCVTVLPVRRLLGGSAVFGLLVTFVILKAEGLRQSLETVFYGPSLFHKHGHADHYQHSLIVLSVMTVLNAIAYFAKWER